MKKEMLNKMIVAPVMLTALSLGACSSQRQNEGLDAGGAVVAPEQERVAKEGAQGGTVQAGGASGVNSSNTQGNRGSGVNNNANDTTDISLAGLNDPNNLLAQRVIYFDYDNSTIRPEYVVIVNTHAKLLAKFPNIKMRLEGHADERGSREYNVALSEQRANSVRRMMGASGARASQIKTIGYGEEVPLEGGHSQKSWQKNRRVEFNYENY